MGVTIPLPVWVWCLRVWVRVDKKHLGVTHVTPYVGGKLKLEETVWIEVGTCSDKIDEEKKRSLFGQCRLVEIHHFWG